VPPFHTVCHVFVGKGTAFDGRDGLRLSSDFPCSSQTFLVVEAGEPVPWTKPSELTYGPDVPLPDLRLLFKDGFRATMADGSRRWVCRETSEESLRASITRTGGRSIRQDR
jgi:hypothetical protein